MAIPEQPRTVALASRKRRLAGYVLDILLFIFTLGLGWLMWFLIIARHGQTPAKAVISLRVVRVDGHVATYGWMLLREIGVKIVAFAVLNAILAWLIGDVGNWVFVAVFAACALWCVRDKDRQCLWDKALTTLVVYDPAGLGAPGVTPASMASSDAAGNLRALAEMRDRGLLTDAEFEERRQRELERL